MEETLQLVGICLCVSTALWAAVKWVSTWKNDDEKEGK